MPDPAVGPAATDLAEPEVVELSTQPSGFLDRLRRALRRSRPDPGSTPGLFTAHQRPAAPTVGPRAAPAPTPATTDADDQDDAEARDGAAVPEIAAPPTFEPLFAAAEPPVPSDLHDLALELERLAFGEEDVPDDDLDAPAEEVVLADELGPALAAPPPPPSTDDASTGVRVHSERLDRRPGPIRMSPSEALALASEGPEALQRGRDRR